MKPLPSIREREKNLLTALAAPGGIAGFWELLATNLAELAVVDLMEMLTEDEEGSFRSVARLKFSDRAWKGDYEILKDQTHAEVVRRAIMSSETQTGAEAATKRCFAVMPVFSKDGGIGALRIETSNSLTKEILVQCEDLADYSAVAVRVDGLQRRLAAALTEEDRIENQLDGLEGRAAAGSVAAELISDTQKWIDAIVCGLLPGIQGDLRKSLISIASEGISKLQSDQAIRMDSQVDQFADLYTLLDESVQVCRDRIAAENLNIGIANNYKMRALVEADPELVSKVLNMLTIHMMSMALPNGAIQIHGVSDQRSLTINLEVSPIQIKTFDSEIMQVLKGDLALHGVDFTFQCTESCKFRLVFSSVKSGEASNKPVDAGNLKVMIVDDDESLRELMVDILESRNYQVVCCEDGVKAIEYFKTDTFDMLITDLGLPKISGSALAEQVRILCPDIPIIMMTGWNSDANPLDKEKLHVDYLLSKPFNLNELLETVETGLHSVKNPRVS